MESIPIDAGPDERDARRRLSVKAEAARAEGGGGVTSVMSEPAMLEDMAVVETAHLQRHREQESHAFSTAVLRALVRRLLETKTKGAVVAALTEIEAAVGPVRLAVRVAKRALSITRCLPDADRDSEAVGSAADLVGTVAAGIDFPEAVLTSVLTESTPATGDGRGWRHIDTRSLVLWAAIKIGVLKLGQLACEIREHAFRSRTGRKEDIRVGGSTGSHRKSGVFSTGQKQLKTRKRELHAKVREHNSVIDEIGEAIMAWVAAHPTVRPPVATADLPPPIDPADVSKPDFDPPQAVATASARSDVAFVDAYRSFRSHNEEATGVGQQRSSAVLDLLGQHYAALGRRIDALNRIFGSRLQGTLAEEIAVAVADGTRHQLLVRHFPRAMLVPSQLVHVVATDEVLTPSDSALLLGLRRYLLHRAGIAEGDLKRAIATLAGSLPVVPKGALPTTATYWVVRGTDVPHAGGHQPVHPAVADAGPVPHHEGDALVAADAAVGDETDRDDQESVFDPLGTPSLDDTDTDTEPNTATDDSE